MPEDGFSPATAVRQRIVTVSSAETQPKNWEVAVTLPAGTPTTTSSPLTAPVQVMVSSSTMSVVRSKSLAALARRMAGMAEPEAPMVTPPALMRSFSAESKPRTRSRAVPPPLPLAVHKRATLPVHPISTAS